MIGRIVFSLSIVLIACAGLTSGVPTAHAQSTAVADEPQKHVLLFASESVTRPTIALINPAIQSTLKERWKSSLQLYEEGLDNLRIPNEKYDGELVRLLQRKYEGVRFDLIFATGPPALRFLLNHQGELFPNTPIVFLSTDQSRIADLTLGSNVTGVSAKVEVTPTLELALTFHPQTQRVVVVTGQGPLDQGLLALARKELAGYEGKLSFNYLTDLTPDEIRQRLAVLPDKTIVIFLSFTRDLAGKNYLAGEAVSLLASSSTAPIYAPSQTVLGNGIVGGRLLSYEAVAQGAAQMGLRILDGESVQSIPQQIVPSVTMFDWRQLRRWGIDDARLPAGSVVRFKEFSFWEMYKWRMLGAISLIVLQALLIVGLLINRSRRRQAEQDNERLARVAEADRRRLDDVVSNVPGIVWEVRSQPGTNLRKATFVSEYVEKLLGYSVDEWLSTPGFALEIIPEEDRERSKREAQALFESGREGVLQFRWVTKDGRIIWVESQYAPIVDEAGKPIGIRGVTMNITDRKAADEALRLSESRFRTMADNAPLLIWMCGPDKLCTYLNQGWLEFTGRTLEQELGSGWTEGIFSEDYARCWETFDSAFDRRDAFRMEYRLRRADGVFCWVYVTGTPRFSSDGEFLGYIGSCFDIADRKAAEEALKKAHEEVSGLKNQLEAENIYLKEEIKLTLSVDEIVGRSNALKYVLFKIEQVSKTDSTVMILGETGTGKELVARAIHSQSLRKDRPLVKVNCAALSASLIESELFGHEKGSFTGASSRKLGRFELADGATLFLDEIGELPLELQPKLLRVIQEGEFERLGGSKTVKVDVRIIAATNRNMKAEVEEGAFREDLWYRLNVFPITVPPLRQRKDDIPPMVEHFVSGFSRKVGKSITAISSASLKKLQDYSWPGNVRELANVIERGVINSQGSILHIADRFEETPSQQLAGASRTLHEIEKDYITRILDDTAWRIEGPNGAAKILGLNPSTLRTRMVKLGIQKSAQASA